MVNQYDLLPHAPSWGPLPRLRKGMDIEGDSHCSDFHPGSMSQATRTPNLVMLGKGVIYWNLQRSLLPGWMSYFTLLGVRELLDLH